MKYTITALCSLFLFSLAVYGCSQPVAVSPTEHAAEQSHAAAAASTVNEYCPIMGGKVTEAGGTVDWNGKTIGFCCDGCDEKWEALSEEEKAEKLAAAQAEGDGEETDAEHAHGEHEHS
ncbi:MAG: hypothetical protein ACE37I_07765 [Rubinisphaera brasiliensis]|uniref:hypothetical protein n=1 Tax=Rubinisphaera brasiliensis TaxID=119 RepID=UPI0039191146